MTNIIGRDELILRLWDDLNQKNGIVLSATRRMGKTSIAKKMQNESAVRKFHSLYLDLESQRNPDEFSRVVAKALQTSTVQGDAKRKTGGILENFVRGGELEVAGFKFRIPQKGNKSSQSWKEALSTEIPACIKSSNSPVILFLDELPIMIDNIIRDGDLKGACEVLDHLRTLRNENHPKLKMVFTGSIGIHLVIDHLKRNGYSNDPLNDLEQVEVTPIGLSYAKCLAKEAADRKRLILVEEDLERLVLLVDCIPHYVIELVSSMAGHDSCDAEVVLKDMLLNNKDNWDLEHFFSRIPHHYRDKAEIVLAILDHLATVESASVSELTSAAQIEHNTDNAAVGTLLRSLTKDQYCQKASDGKISFRFGLMKLWWKCRRDLL